MEKVDLLKNYGVDVNSSLEFWGDTSSYFDALKEFRDSLDDKIKDLEYYKDNEDFNNYGILAHSTKSEAKYLGFMKDAEVFLQHEMAGKESNKVFINNDFKTLKETGKRIKDLLDSCFSDSNGSDSKKIIIADDSNIMLNFIEKNITGDYEIIRANNGLEAISKIEENKIYAILLDLNMPNMNGFQVLDYMKEKELFDKIPVIIITGDDTEETIKKAFTYPIIDVLNKPFKEENIKRILGVIENFYEKC